MSMNTRLSKPIRVHQSGCLVLVLSITGCTLAPTYERPSSPVPPAQGASLLPGRQDMPAVPGDHELSSDEDLLISQLSPDGQLRFLVRSALTFNRDIRLAALRVQEAQALYGMTGADRLPTVAAGLERDRQHFDNAATNERYGQNLVVASIGVTDFELDFFGRVRSLSDAARHDYLATTYGQQAARGALVVQVAKVYLMERLAAAQQVQARLVDATEQALLEVARTQQQEGALSVDDVVSQQVHVQRAHVQLQAATLEYARTAQALLLVTGYATPLPVMTFEPAHLDEGTPEPSLDVLVDMPSERLLKRLDIRQSEERLKAANANIGAARAAFFPSIKLSTGIGTSSDSLQSLFKSGSGAWLFTPQLSLPLFDGGRNQANLQLAEVRKQIAVAEYEHTVQVAFREVADVLARRRQLLDDLRSESALSRLAQDTAKRVAIELDVGGAGSTVMLTSKLRLAEADMAMRQAHQAVLLNRLDIYRVLLGVDAAPSQLISDNGAAP
ncbi:efflux transporter outer membrane subunit [Pseudomonas yamanorum]|uniref:efflux transporter outer membrane subunit n=1 Tax=Pseudomonas yamanorum TaxID=515393 RepID=UPI001C47E007|nr:efflux transporter outer membrane subunit [Pseudomonas yamanorum]MBV6659748.1 efflux transporter outer membrane subunit [Pseudomonas yamanorum]